MSCSKTRCSKRRFPKLSTALFAGVLTATFGALVLYSSPEVFAQSDAIENAKTEATEATEAAETAADKMALRPAATPTQESVDKLIAELDADTLVERDAAEQALMDVGPSALPFLPSEDRQMPAEARIRLQRVVEDLRSRKIESFVRATKVSLTGEMTAAEALTSIADQTGNVLSLGNVNGSAELDLDIQDEDFWPALDSVLDAAGLTVTPYGGGQNSIEITPRERRTTARTENVSYSGVFRMEVIKITSERSALYDYDRSMTVRIRIRWEPRLTPVYFRLPMEDFVLTTDDGRELRPSEQSASPEYSPQGFNSQIEVDFRVGLPDRSAKQVQRLVGGFTVALPGENVILEFDQLGRPGKKVQEVANLSVEVEQVRPNGKIYELRVLVSLSGAKQTLESFRSWFMTNDAFISDDKDRRSEHIGFNTYKMVENQIGVAYLFSMPNGLDDYKFIYEAPGAVSEKSYSFEFRGLELP
jgi:hypothetical protein